MAFGQSSCKASTTTTTTTTSTTVIVAINTTATTMLVIRGISLWLLPSSRAGLGLFLCYGEGA